MTNIEKITDTICNIDHIIPLSDTATITELNEKLENGFDVNIFRELYQSNKLDMLSYAESILKTLGNNLMSVEDLLNVINETTNGDVTMIKHIIDCYATITNKVNMADLCGILKHVITVIPINDPIPIMLQIIHIYIYNNSKGNPVHEYCYKYWINSHYYLISQKSQTVQYIYFMLLDFLKSDIFICKSNVSQDLFEKCNYVMQKLYDGICDCLD